jgi:hypothetical protein
LLTVIVFYAAYGLFLGLLMLIVYIISKIPLLEFLANIIVVASKGFLPDIICGLCGFAAVYSVFSIFSKIIKKEQTLSLSFKISGVILIALNILFLIINLIYGDSVLTNIIFIVDGFLLFKYDY